MANLTGRNRTQGWDDYALVVLISSSIITLVPHACESIQFSNRETGIPLVPTCTKAAVYVNISCCSSFRTTQAWTVQQFYTNTNPELF